MSETTDNNKQNKNPYSLEHDLFDDIYIGQKVKSNPTYAQHLYAALCNNLWQKKEVISILKGLYWGCGWKRAADIVTEMREEGDYLGFYCSGAFVELNLTDLENRDIYLGNVMEGTVTNEVREDLLRIGWKQYFSKNNDDYIM